MLMNNRGTMLSSFMGKMAHKNAALSLSQIMSTSRAQVSHLISHIMTASLIIIL